MRPVGLVVAACLSMSPILARSLGDAGKPIAEFQGHILPNDRDFKLRLMKDGAANATWIGAAGRRFEFGGFYTVTGGSYEVSLKARDEGQFYQRLNLSIRSDSGQHRGDWTSERQRAARAMSELRLVRPGITESANSPAAGANLNRGKPVVAVIRSGTRARTTSARQTAAAQRITARSFRSASKRIARATRKIQRRK